MPLVYPFPNCNFPLTTIAAPHLPYPPSGCPFSLHSCQPLYQTPPTTTLDSLCTSSLVTSFIWTAGLSGSEQQQKNIKKDIPYSHYQTFPQSFPPQILPPLLICIQIFLFDIFPTKSKLNVQNSKLCKRSGASGARCLSIFQDKGVAKRGWQIYTLHSELT